MTARNYRRCGSLLAAQAMISERVELLNVEAKRILTNAHELKPHSQQEWVELALARRILAGVQDYLSRQIAECCKFVAVGKAVMLGPDCVGTMFSKTFAKRTARALNLHKPNREGV